MKAGPKRQLDAGPLDLSMLPASGGDRAIAFVETFLRLPKGRGAGQLISLREWQREVVRGLFDDPRPRQGLLSVARKNGKSLLAACLALYALFADGEEGAEVLIVAADERQARVVFNLARRQVELSPELSEQVWVYADRIVYPATDSVLEPLPAEGDRLQGRNPSLAVVDELHVVREETWDAMALAGGTRERPLTLAISTAAGDRDGVMWRLTEHGRRGKDPSFFYRCWSAEGCRLDDEEAWALANPALGDFLSVEHLRATVGTTREDVFRRFHLNAWVGQVGSWLPWGLWESRADPGRVVEPGARIVAAFDGSASSDSTALIGCTIEAEPHVFVLGLWEKNDDPRWRVDRADVMARVEAVFSFYDVAELCADTFGWRSEVEQWSAQWPGKVLEHGMGAARMGPAVDRTYVAIAEGKLSHDGDERMAQHIANAVAARSPFGDTLRKDSRESVRRIDAAIGVVLAVSRSAYHHRNAAKKRRVASF